ncbi:TPA: ANR family transcriptional regulator [Citrobacter farmeri]|uniref:ANR family transcriptional regulator n=1 Tax=Citrobacter amalonaticus TaxID=35703 RepID=UPI000D6AE533|nr:ANR family transcriptional regulator [Citrobacter amalonaticus]QZA35385.1 ANR family transcriptional regulator [Citrobacter amalonaticus]
MAILFDRARTGKPCSPFMSYAASAVIAEQKGDFGRAAEEWAAALSLAQRSVNAEWAGSRMDFCSNAAMRGWGVPGESESV